MVLIAALALAAFAVSAQEVVETRPYIGVGIAADEAGVRVTAVAPGSPAEAAGLQIGDIITAVNSTAVTFENVGDVVAGFQVGDTITLTMLRGEESLDIAVTLAAAPQAAGGRPGRGNLIEIVYDAEAQTWTIVALDENHPLYAQGLRAGDVITAFNGQAYDAQGLIEFVRGLDADATITVTVQRGDETLDIEIQLAELRMFAGGRGPGRDGGQPGGPMGGGRLGVVFLTLDAQIASEQGVDVTDGALVMEVQPGSPAETAGLQVNDVITAVNGEAVDAEHTLHDRMVAYEPGDTVTLTVLRGGETLEIEVTLGQFPVPMRAGDMGPGMMGNGNGGGNGFGNQPVQPPQPEGNGL
jgi:S1-C subfamily serine protease